MHPNMFNWCDCDEWGSSWKPSLPTKELKLHPVETRALWKGKAHGMEVSPENEADGGRGKITSLERHKRNRKAKMARKARKNSR